MDRNQMENQDRGRGDPNTEAEGCQSAMRVSGMPPPSDMGLRTNKNGRGAAEPIDGQP